MSHTPIPPVEGYACYLAARSLANGSEVSEPSAEALFPWDRPAMDEPSSSLTAFQLRKSLDDLDEETDDDDDDLDLDDEDEEDEDDLDDDYDDDEEDDEDEDDEDEDEDEDDEDEDEEEDDVKPLKMVAN